MSKNKEKAPQVVAFLGPDGAGKSTILSLVVQDLERRGQPPKTFYFAPGFLPRYRPNGDGAVTTNPHEGRQYGPVLIAAKIALMLFEFRMGLRAVRRRHRLALFDRFIHDLLIDPKRYRMGQLRWWMRAMIALAPRPDLLVVISAPAEVIHARKQEVPFAETERQILAYAALAETFPNACVIVNTASPEAAAQQIIAKIFPQ